MQEITGIEPYSACKKLSAWFSYPRTDIPASMSLLCHKSDNSALFKKNKLKTQKRRKANCSGTTRSVRCLGHVEVSQSQQQSQNRPNQHVSLQDYTLLIHHIGCSREAICSHALPRAERRQYRTLHTISVVS